MESIRLHIPSELFAPAESSRFEGTARLPEMSVGPDTYRFDAPLTWTVDVTNTGDAFLVAGTVTGVASTSCARCLADIGLDLQGEIEGYFLIDDQGTPPEDFERDEFDVLPDDHTIDLEPLIQAALRLEVPLVPLCKSDCKGLCPHCGADLNEGPCECENDSTDEFESAKNPFSVLKDYDFGS